MFHLVSIIVVIVVVTHLLRRHMLERVRQLLLAEGKLSNRPDLGVLPSSSSLALPSPPSPLPPTNTNRGTYRLEILLDLIIETSALERNDGRAVGCVSDRRPALGAEPPVDGVSAVGGSLPLLEGAFDLELVLEDDGDECWGGGGG